MADEDTAATKLQAIQRGNNARKERAESKAGSAEEAAAAARLRSQTTEAELLTGRAQVEQALSEARTVTLTQKELRAEL